MFILHIYVFSWHPFNITTFRAKVREDYITSIGYELNTHAGAA